jgi:hypothetical protein
MRQSGVLALLRGIVALLVLAAIAVQIIDNVGQGTFNPTRFFAFFTILSNLFGAILFLVLAARYRESRSDTLDLLRGANVVYLTVTFIVVIWLLSGADLQVAIPWVDFVLHKLFPVLAVIDWLIDPPINWITPRRALVWLAYPLVWVTATLIRGAADGWYPYPFLNPANGGYGSVAFYVTTILVGFLAISAVTLWLGNAVRER